jgi:hypothetical protein
MKQYSPPISPFSLHQPTNHAKNRHAEGSLPHHTLHTLPTGDGGGGGGRGEESKTDEDGPPPHPTIPSPSPAAAATPQTPVVVRQQLLQAPAASADFAEQQLFQLARKQVGGGWLVDCGAGVWGVGGMGVVCHVNQQYIHNPMPNRRCATRRWGGSSSSSATSVRAFPLSLSFIPSSLPSFLPPFFGPQNTNKRTNTHTHPRAHTHAHTHTHTHPTNHENDPPPPKKTTPDACRRPDAGEGGGALAVGRGAPFAGSGG